MDGYLRLTVQDTPATRKLCDIAGMEIDDDGCDAGTVFGCYADEFGGYSAARSLLDSIADTGAAFYARHDSDDCGELSTVFCHTGNSEVYEHEAAPDGEVVVRFATGRAMIDRLANAAEYDKQERRAAAVVAGEKPPTKRPKNPCKTYGHRPAWHYRECDKCSRCGGKIEADQ